MENLKKINIEEVFAKRFSRYSKYIIQERALPDIRDGLKPVQRRILYAMYKDNNIFDKQFRKSAKTVGNVIGNYHPHGDSSVYEAMVRMSQNWKVNSQLVIMHGNNGSIDGDNPAAMRYTEAKLSEYSNFMLSDINYDTVMMVPNFDDTETEPNVLPCRIPNLLINGTSGIASGYATDIPPHNVTEVINAALYLNENSKASLSELMKYVKAPDFPTGGVLYGDEGIKQAYETGRGKIILRAKYKIDKNDIIISEIPYDVNKATLLQKIEALKVNKKIEGINEIIDQSDQVGLEIKITCADSVDTQLVMNFLLKNTELQKNYNFNMIAIDNSKPKLMGIKEILASFLDHREDVILNRSNFKLKKAQGRLHIVSGISLAVLNIDKIVELIRSSSNKKEAKEKLESEFSLSQEQSEAIVMMPLYKLTSTDIAVLEDEKKELEDEISELGLILNDNNRLKEIVKEELEEVKKEVSAPRKTKIEKTYVEIEIDKKDLIKKEETIVVITKQKYIKRSNLRSYLTAKSNPELIEGDNVLKIIKVNTRDDLIVFFDNGQYALVPAYSITDTKWKETPKSLGNLIRDGEQGNVINIEKFNPLGYYMSVSKKGYMIKIKADEFDSKKENSRIKYQGLKEDDKIISVTHIKDKKDFILITDQDRGMVLSETDIENMSLKRSGKKIKELSSSENVAHIKSVNKNILLMSEHGYYSKINIDVLKENNFKFEPLLTNMKKNKQNMIYCISDIQNKILVVMDSKYEEIKVGELKSSSKLDKVKKMNKLDNIQSISHNLEV